MNETLSSVIDKAAKHVSKEFAIEVEPHAMRYIKNLKSVENAVASGDKRRIRARVFHTLNSHSSKLVCLTLSLKKNHSAEDLCEMAQALDPRKQCSEFLEYESLLKSSGEGRRDIYKFRIKRRALHRLSTDILEVIQPLSERVYLKKGMGVEKASDEICRLIKEEKCRYFVLADIKDYFDSVQHHRVREVLELPDAVIKQCILIVGMTLFYILDKHLFTQPFDGTGQKGIPQGSRASGYVASLLLGSALEQFAPMHFVVIYGDDIAIGARNKKEANALMETLKSALEADPAGPFCFKRCEVKHVREGFDFAKYHFRMKLFFFGGEIVLRPSNMSYRRFKRKVAAHVKKKAKGKHGWVLDVLRYRTNWLRAFPRWKRSALSLQHVNSLVQEGILEGLDMPQV